MSESKHTPGPWKACINGVVKAGRYNVCPTVTAGGSSKGMIDERDVINANAALIAAAPELLASLVAMTSAFESHLPDHCNPDWYQEWNDAKAAIAKATGSAA